MNCEDNIKMDIGHIVCEDIKWIELAEYHAQWWTLILVMLHPWVLLQMLVILVIIL